MAVHESWWREYHGLKKNNNKRREMDIELETGQILMEIKPGYQTSYNSLLKNKIGGNVDLVLDGKDTELYMPEKSSGRRVESKLHEKQSEYYLIRFDQELNPEMYDRIKSKIYDYKNRYGIKVKLLFNIKKPFLEEVE